MKRIQFKVGGGSFMQLKNRHLYFSPNTENHGKCSVNSIWGGFQSICLSLQQALLPEQALGKLQVVFRLENMVGKVYELN